MVGESDNLRATAPASRDTVVLLGASNLARGISTVVEAARHTCGRPLDLFTAMGHGRSYGQTSSVLGRRLPGILQSEIWEALGARSHQQVLALVTDIGNDLLYNVPVPEIASWIDQCLERLSSLNARMILTRLPMETLSGLTPSRFRFFRTILFPQNRYDLATALRLAAELDGLIGEIADRHGATLVVPAKDWYGIDPIHLKWSAWGRAWPRILAHWKRPLGTPELVQGSFSQWLYLRTRTPSQRCILGWQQNRSQPSAWLSDGSTVAAY